MGTTMTVLTRREAIKKTAAFVGMMGGELVGSLASTRAVAATGKKSVVLASMGPVTGNWDPTSHTTLGQLNFESFVFSKLTRCPMEKGKTDEILPDLATSWKMIDQHTLEFTLRQGVKFHDGKAFGAEDVKATMEYACQPTRPAGVLYPGLVDVEVVDPLTVRLKTHKYGYPASAYWFVSSFLPILSANDVANAATLQKRPNGTGPFRYVSTDGDKNAIAANDDYYGGRPKIDEVIYSYVPDSNTRVLGLLNGQYQIIERLEPEQYESLVADGTVATHRELSSENKYLHFRCNKPPFDDVRVRMAACHAIDRSQILTVLGEAAKPSSCYLSPLKFGYIDIPGYPDFDPDECQKLLAEAGFPKGQGLPELEYITSIGFYPKTKEYGELIVAMMAEQGFNVRLTVLEPAAWEQAIYRRADGQGPGHMCDVGWITGSPEPDLVLRPNFYSKAALINGIDDPAIDAALDKERSCVDAVERLRILQMETLPTIARAVPSFSLFSAVNFHGTVKNLQGVYFFPNGPIDLSKADLV
jgi:peptide/nickel transport system substrate-binding protein